MQALSNLMVAATEAIAYMVTRGTTRVLEKCYPVLLILFYEGALRAWSEKSNLCSLDMMTTDQLITFLLYQMQLGENLYNIGYVMTGLMECVGASRKVFEYMYREPEIPNDGDLKPPLNGRIEFKEVEFTYPSRPNNKVLKGLDLVIEAGRTTALVGPSGGWKIVDCFTDSTFLRANQWRYNDRWRSKATYSDCASALVRNPIVLILDEATSALDAESEAIGAGGTEQTGNHSELMADVNGLYYSLVSKQILSSKIKGNTIEDLEQQP
ncbi:hypothetical protein OSTOST_08480 [Ostertagia ostertagi]